MNDFFSKKIQSEQQEFNEYKHNYRSEIDKHLSFAGKKHDFYTKVKADYLLKQAKHLQIDLQNINLKILDIGCGHGMIHPFILNEDKNLELHGIDPANEVIEIAKKQNTNVNYEVNDGITLPYADNSFDIVFSICVMHHVSPENWQQFLQEAYRVTAKKGELIIIEHNPYNPLTRYIVNTCPLDKNAILLKPQQLKNMMRNISTIGSICDFILFFPFESKFFQKLEEQLTWLPLGAQYAVRIRK
ncbi:class I SAM-dependent methyltransferase [Candidatus Venteria ishoeyi]|uniref:Putative methyltransferase YcgJ n=1 Tax=Candidatus Venteria ishoeyi TaxID=1899563 RepID=A0A1H6F8H8_9GAMM|nr:methyltransferase domain-containing protein [Candidatus Venteria ishoeyi]SEH05619.1 putative methyltransferase YcgJ [Candidatus Venteria ishoeyi]